MVGAFFVFHAAQNENGFQTKVESIHETRNTHCDGIHTINVVDHFDWMSKFQLNHCIIRYCDGCHGITDACPRLTCDAWKGSQVICWKLLRKNCQIVNRSLNLNDNRWTNVCRPTFHPQHVAWHHQAAERLFWRLRLSWMRLVGGRKRGLAGQIEVEGKNKAWLTCRRKASGIVNVLEIQQ